MASKSKSRPAARRATEFQPQDLFFAGIGAVSIGRKKAASLYAKAGPAASLVAAYARDAQEQAVIAAARARSKVRSLAAQAGSRARQQLAPVFARLGIAGKAPARGRGRKQPTARRRAA
jgi:hypothetical protein